MRIIAIKCSTLCYIHTIHNFILLFFLCYPVSNKKAVLSQGERCRCKFRYYIEFYSGIVWFLCHSTAFLYTSRMMQGRNFHPKSGGYQLSYLIFCYDLLATGLPCANRPASSNSGLQGGCSAHAWFRWVFLVTERCRLGADYIKQ